MDIKNAIMLLEHTSYDDFNLEEHQIIGRLQAIECLVNELKKKDEVIEKAISFIGSIDLSERPYVLYTDEIEKLLQILEDKEVE